MKDLSVLKQYHYDMWNYIIREIGMSDKPLDIRKIKECFFDETHISKPIGVCFMCEYAEIGLELEKTMHEVMVDVRCKYCPSVLANFIPSTAPYYCLSGVYKACCDATNRDQQLRLAILIRDSWRD